MDSGRNDSEGMGRSGDASEGSDSTEHYRPASIGKRPIPRIRLKRITGAVSRRAIFNSLELHRGEQESKPRGAKAIATVAVIQKYLKLGLSV